MPLYMDRHDLPDATAADVSAAHMRDLEVVRAALARFGGSEVKHTGNGIMAALTSAFQAVSAGMQIQQALQERDESAQGHLHVRVGVAAGEPVTEQDDLFGAAVQQAARLCACAQPDRIVVSSGVHDLCRGKGIRFSDGGLIAVKGFDEPIGNFEVKWHDDGNPPSSNSRSIQVLSLDTV